MREKRIDYKTKHMKGLMFRGSKAMPKIVITEEDKALRKKIWKAESQLDRILGKIKMGLEVTEIEKKRVPMLKARIEHLKSKLFNHSPSRTNIPEKE